MPSKYFSSDFCASWSIRFIMLTEFLSVSFWIIRKLAAKTDRMLVSIAMMVITVMVARIERIYIPP